MTEATEAEAMEDRNLGYGCNNVEEFEEDSMLNIYQRLHAIMKDVSYIQKSDKKVNKMYTFVTHDAVTAKIRPALLKHGVLAVPNYFDISQDGNKTSCSMSMTFICVDNPDDRLVIDCAGFGQGIDPQDKGAGKAMSYAYKYALLKVFALETGDDPEKDNIDHATKQQEDLETASRKKWEDWKDKYIEALYSGIEGLEEKYADKLDELLASYPDLHKVIVTATDKVRGE